MTRPLGRRHVLAMLVSSALSTTLSQFTLAGPRDQGIGGTGAAPPTDQSDRGIGGTGVIGTIRRFGSIIVNDLRIAYPPDAEVRIDGRPASVGDLKIGQVVRVVTTGGPDGLSTRMIDVASEVVGPVERVGAKQIVVLGQTISTAAVKGRTPQVGETVAISGLRRNDGTIVASLIESRDGGTTRVAGPVRLDSDGALRIGGLTLAGADGSLVGRRAVVEGTARDDRLEVAHATTEAALFPPEVRTLSIESYVQRRGDRLVLGSGFNVSGAGSVALPPGRSVRAVVSTSVRSDGTLGLDGLRSGGRSYVPGGPDSGRGNERNGGPGGTGRTPMDFGPGHSDGRPSPGGGAPSLPGGTPGGGFPGGGGPGGGGPGGGFPGGGLPGGGPTGGFGGGGFGGGRH